MPLRLFVTSTHRMANCSVPPSKLNRQSVLCHACRLCHVDAPLPQTLESDGSMLLGRSFACVLPKNNAAQSRRCSSTPASSATGRPPQVVHAACGKGGDGTKAASLAVPAADLSLCSTGRQQSKQSGCLALLVYSSARWQGVLRLSLLRRHTAGTRTMARVCFEQSLAARGPWQDSAACVMLPAMSRMVNAASVNAAQSTLCALLHRAWHAVACLRAIVRSSGLLRLEGGIYTPCTCTAWAGGGGHRHP